MKLKDVLNGLLLAGAAVVVLTAATPAPTGDAKDAKDSKKVRIPVGHAAVVTSDEAIKTVAIAEEKIADAAVGSERTVVVNAKSAGTTSLVVYNQGGQYTIYDIECYVPNSERQVSLHVRVAEVDDAAKRQLGIDLAGTGSLNVPGHHDVLTGGLFTTKITSPSIPLSLGTTTDGAVQYNRDNGNFLFQATWHALEEKGDIRVLANPTLVSRSGQKASFLAGGEFPVPIASSTAPGAAGSAVTVTVEWKEFGVKLDFMPTILEDGTLQLDVAPEVSQLDFSNSLVLNGFTIPIVDTRKAQTSVHLNAGEHLVVGGLKQTFHTETHRKVPILGDIPIVRWLFTSTFKSTEERELMVVVSPEIIDNGAKLLPALPTDKPEKH